MDLVKRWDSGTCFVLYSARAGSARPFDVGRSDTPDHLPTAMGEPMPTGYHVPAGVGHKER